MTLKHLCGPEDVPRFLCFPPGPVFGQRPHPPPTAPRPAARLSPRPWLQSQEAGPGWPRFGADLPRERLAPYRKPPLGPKQHVRVSPGTDSGKG